MCCHLIPQQLCRLGREETFAANLLTKKEAEDTRHYKPSANQVEKLWHALNMITSCVCI